jgi:hypothetical protein
MTHLDNMLINATNSITNELPLGEPSRKSGSKNRFNSEQVRTLDIGAPGPAEKVSFVERLNSVGAFLITCLRGMASSTEGAMKCDMQ